MTSVDGPFGVDRLQYPPSNPISALANLSVMRSIAAHNGERGTCIMDEFSKIKGYVVVVVIDKSRSLSSYIRHSNDR